MNTLKAKTKNFKMPRLIWEVCASFIMMTAQLSASGSAMDAKVQTDAVGNAVAVWEFQGGGSTSIQGAYRLASGNSWSEPQQLSPVGSQSVNFMSKDPKIAINAAGNAVVIWRSVDPATQISQIYASTISLQGIPTWTSAVAISNQAVLSSYQDTPYSVKLSENGQAIALWQSALFDLMSATSTVDGTNTWSSPVTVVGTNSGS